MRNFRPVLAIAALLLVFGLGACAADEASPSGADTVSTPNADTSEDAGTSEEEASAMDGDDDGRAFNASQGNVITVIEQALSSDNASARWEGSTIMVQLDGSRDAAGAHTPCLAVETIIADSESATLVFSDGELVCADRYNER